MNEYALEKPGMTFEIIGSDISQNVLEKAARGVYPEKAVSMIPLDLKRKYLLRSKNRENPTVRVAPLLQKNFSLKYLNLMDSVYDIKEGFDIIFCRNVLIYFDRETQERVVQKLCEKLRPGATSSSDTQNPYPTWTSPSLTSNQQSSKETKCARI